MRFEKLMKKIDKLYKQGKLNGLAIEDIKSYVENNEGQRGNNKRKNKIFIEKINETKS